MIRWRITAHVPTFVAAFALTVVFPCESRADGHTENGGRGAAVFSKYCVLCHGANGKGDGRAVSLQKVPPANLTISPRSLAYKVQIIRKGGGAMGRSAGMPAWNGVLSEEELAEVAAYVHSLRNRALSAKTDRSIVGSR